MAVCQNLVPLVNIKIAGKLMFIPLKMVLIGIDPYPYIYIYTHTFGNQFIVTPNVRTEGCPGLPLQRILKVSAEAGGIRWLVVIPSPSSYWIPPLWVPNWLSGSHLFPFTILTFTILCIWWLQYYTFIVCSSEKRRDASGFPWSNILNLGS